MIPDPALTPADQVFSLVDLVLKTLGPEAHKRRIGRLSCSIWNRVRKFERRFYALYAMWKAGTLRKRRHPHPGPPPARGIMHLT